MYWHRTFIDGLNAAVNASPDVSGQPQLVILEQPKNAELTEERKRFDEPYPRRNIVRYKLLTKGNQVKSSHS